MSLMASIVRAHNVDVALGKRDAYLRVLLHVMAAQLAETDPDARNALDAVYVSVSVMHEEAKAEYEAAKAVPSDA